MDYLIEIEQFTLVVRIAHLLVVPPNPRTWASRDDHDGYRELEWDVVDGTETDEDGEVFILDQDELVRIIGEHAGLIEQQLWQEIETERRESRMEAA